MGFSITWCAVREDQADVFLEALKLVPTGATEEVPEALISCARLGTGWRLVWYGKYGCSFLRPEDIRQLSVDRDVLLCLIEEHVMASSAEMWSRGERRWWISHEGEDGPKGLSSDGELPSMFPAIRDEMLRLQEGEGGDEAEVDYIFEIPLKVAQAIVGFKHDEEPVQLSEGHFVVLSRNEPQKESRKGWLARLFG